MPFLFNISILKPIVKDTKKSNKDANNLRSVAVSDAFSNIFEAVLLNELEKQYTDKDQQFCFKKNSSCSHAVFVLKQAIKLSNHLKRRLYVCAIDASKAFDKVIRMNLWKKLISKNIHPAIAMSIIKYYGESLMIIQMGYVFSKLFKTSLGVRQGTFFH